MEMDGTSKRKLRIFSKMAAMRRTIARASTVLVRDPARKIRIMLKQLTIGFSSGEPITCEEGRSLRTVPYQDAIPNAGARCNVYGAEEVVVRDHVFNHHSARDERQFYANHVALAPEMTLANPGAHFWFPRSGMLLSPDGRAWSQSLMRGLEPRLLKKTRSVTESSDGKYMFHPHVERSAPRIEGVALLVAQSERQNYGHFLFDIVPLIDLGLEIGAPMVSWPMSAWQRSICARMGLTMGRVREIPALTHLIDQPIISNRLSGNGTSCVHPRVRPIFEKIKANVAADSLEPKPRRFFLMRSQRGHRRLNNQVELAEALAVRGIVALRPETLSFDDQVTLFSGAELIVAEFGAALANVVFCAPNVRIVEIICEGQNDPWSAHLCGMLNLEHIVLFQPLTDIMRAAEPLWKLEPAKLEYFADVKAICAVVDQLI